MPTIGLRTLRPATPTAEPPDWPAVSRGLHRLAVALCGSQNEADDLTQQTLLILLTRRPDRVGHVGYARQTLTRLWLDRQRSLRRRARRLALLAASPLQLAPAPRHDEVARLRAQLDLLPPRQKLVLTLRLIEELTCEQIAELLECDPGAVRSTLHLARRRVRLALGEGP